MHRNIKHSMTLCTFNARRSHFYCGTVRMFCILQGRVARTSLLGHFDVNSIFCHCGWFSAAVRAASAAVALKCCRLASLCFALPRTIATPIARLNCCSMIGLIGYAPPFLSVLMRGEIFIPSSLDAASLQGALYDFLKVFALVPSKIYSVIARIGMVPQYPLFISNYICSK